MVINVVTVGLAGVLVPVLFERAGQDPAVASSVFVTMVTDSMGFFAFLGLAVGEHRRLFELALEQSALTGGELAQRVRGRFLQQIVKELALAGEHFVGQLPVGAVDTFLRCLDFL